MDCPHCGAKNRDRTKFCRLCAQRIGGLNDDSSADAAAAGAAATGAGAAGANTTDVARASRNRYAGIVALLLLAGSGAVLLSQRNADSVDVSPAQEEKPAVMTAPAPVPATPSPAVTTAPVAPDPAPKPGVSGDPAGAVGMDEKVFQSFDERERASQKKRPDTKAKPSRRKPAPIVAAPIVEMLPPAPEPQPTSPVVIKLTGIAADLAACAGKVFPAKDFCEERVRWRYCQGKWGKTAECPRMHDPSEGGG